MENQNTCVFEVYESYDEFIVNTMGLADMLTEIQCPIPTEDLNSINDLLSLIEFLEEKGYDQMDPKYHRLCNCKNILTKFNKMIGLKEPKSHLATQVLSLCNRSIKGSDDETEDNEENDIHSVIYGPPGCGKTTLANLLSEIYLQLGVINSKKIIRGNRANLIGEYIGQTEVKTTEMLTSALGGVFFLDEAYQLGHAESGNRDSFAKACIDTLVQFITDHKGELVIILAGYEEDIKENFFGQNEGLDRRFPFKYRLEGYKSEELCQIFCHQADKLGYQVNNDPDNPVITADFFKSNETYFKFYGGDTENFITCCKMIHDKRMFAFIGATKHHRVLNKTDIEKGFKMFKRSKDVQDSKKEAPFMMYN